MENPSEENKIIEIKFSVENRFKWMAQDQDGSVAIFEEKPNQMDGVWDSPGDFKLLTQPEANAMLANWEDSLIPI